MPSPREKAPSSRCLNQRRKETRRARGRLRAACPHPLRRPEGALARGRTRQDRDGRRGSAAEDPVGRRREVEQRSEPRRFGAPPRPHGNLLGRSPARPALCVEDFSGVGTPPGRPASGEDASRPAVASKPCLGIFIPILIRTPSSNGGTKDVHGRRRRLALGPVQNTELERGAFR